MKQELEKSRKLIIYHKGVSKPEQPTDEEGDDGEDIRNKQRASYVTSSGRVFNSINQLVASFEALAADDKSDKVLVGNAAEIVEKLFDSCHLRGILHEQFLKPAKKYLRKHVFSPERILRVMVYKGGTLLVETDGVSWVTNTVIPSTAEMQR